ncbi:hypothetical protein HDG34_002808 [Paraburkholderia sp. HC6.4b]|uniref:hypothetical protein n=1 Tax=unclassified Paraburkholderia TaxID=2615204 RepID=UPI00160D615A|nr:MULTISPECIES: hypothetical protein [unclassified Paraburkholderia]MBB5408871.1 hypothetical protein [Paraburkholderia sp. HC6.4b]MBB5450599.1 hypothetical protein [Paraburkholderia sp. Kb1A]
MAARKLRGTIHSMYQQQSTYTEPACAAFQEGNILSANADEAPVAAVSQDCIDGITNAALQQQADLPPPVSLTVLLSPVPITKSFSLSPEGQLDKQIHGNVSSGKLLLQNFDSVDEFAELLELLTPQQCCIYGVAPHPEMELMTEAVWQSAGRPKHAIPRKASAFAWPAGLGVLMLDYDAPKDGSEPLDRNDLFDLLHSVCPVLAECDSVWMPSTSSEIYNADTGECLAGIKGQRIYFIVEDAADIPRAGKELLVHLWAAGHGHVEVSSSGSLLERGVFDSTVWQTNRIDFAGGADCKPPLEQRRHPLVQIAAKRTVDTKTVIPTAPPEVVAVADKYKAAARIAVATIAAQKLDEWREARFEQFTKSNPTMPSDLVTRMLDYAVDPQRKQLMADWSITVVDPEGNHQPVTVGEVLADPQRYDGMLTLDPLEPDYDGGRVVGKLFLSGRQNLFSFAHGGVSFALCNKVVKIEKRKGYEREMADHVMKIMRDHPEIYEFGNSVVRVIDGKPVALNENSLRYWLGGMVQFYRLVSSNGHQVEVLEDPSDKLFKMILSPGVPRNFKRLKAVISAPTLRPDGSLLIEPGYDVKTGLLLQVDHEFDITVPMFPTEEQARKALEKLWYPFRQFPFVDHLGRSAHLAALLTAAVRPAVPAVPAFGYDAPTQGSGKTLLAQCAALLTTGIEPELYPPVYDDAEMRKRLFAALLAGDRAIVLDNIVGTFDSASMAAMLTTEQFKDRVLSKSEVSSVPNNAVVLLTGNNMVLSGDMARRVVVCRIDANVETPFGRSFDVDPLPYCQTHRLEMIVAALTLIRFCLTSAEFKPARGRVASFEEWDKFVRQTVIFIAQTLAPNQFGDVMDLLKQNQSEDPERDGLRDLLCALQASFGSRTFTAKEIFSACGRASSFDTTDTRLDEAVLAVSPNPKLTTSGIGRLLKYRRDRICDGLSLKVASDNKNGRTWRVVGGS